MMTSGDQWSWSPDMPEMNYVPVLYYDPPMASWRKAPITFVEGDPADAVAWLENKTGLGCPEDLEMDRQVEEMERRIQARVRNGCWHGLGWECRECNPHV